MNILKLMTLAALMALVTACSEAPGVLSEGIDQGSVDRSIDGGVDGKHLSTLVAGIWVDPNGCDHWIIDDGVEGYLSERLTPDGRPVCSGAASPKHVTGPFKQGSSFGDFF